MNSLEKNAKAAKSVNSRTGPKSKRTKQEDKVLGDIVDDCCGDSKPEKRGSKNSNKDECDRRNSEDRTITPARNTSDFETTNIGRMLDDGSEELQHSPRNDGAQTSTQAGRRTGDEASQGLLAEQHKDECIRKPNEEASQSISMSHGSISVEGNSTGKLKEAKSKLPKCKYGKSCYR